MHELITLRPAALGDYPHLAQMLRTLAQTYIVPGMPVEAAATFLRSNDEAGLLAYREQGHVASVAEVGGIIAGFIAVRPPSHLFHLFVAQDFHRRGIARALWEHARGEAGVCTVNSSPYAVPAYAAMGFACDGPPACHNGVTFQPMIYRRS